MKRKEIIIYPDNTGCVDGKSVTRKQALEILALHGIDEQRPFDLSYNTPEARIIAFGRAQAPAKDLAAMAAKTRRERGMADVSTSVTQYDFFVHK